MSPEALATLHRSGALPRVEALPHRKLVGHEIWSYDGSHLRGTYHAFGAYAPFRPYGIAVRWLLFDHELLRHAATFPPVTVREGFRVDDLIRIGGRVVGVRGQGDSGPESFAAPLTVGADGVNSVVARCLGLTRQDPDVRKCAMVAYFRGMEIGNYGEVHLGESGYFAMAAVDEELTNINLPDGANCAAPTATRKLYVGAGAQPAARRAAPGEASAPSRHGSMARRSKTPSRPARSSSATRRIRRPVTGGHLIALRSAGRQASPGARPGRQDAASKSSTAGARPNSAHPFVLARSEMPVPPVDHRYVVRTSAQGPARDRVIGMSGDYIPPEAVFNLAFFLRFFNPFHRRRAAAVSPRGQPQAG